MRDDSTATASAALPQEWKWGKWRKFHCSTGRFVRCFVVLFQRISSL